MDLKTVPYKPGLTVALDAMRSESIESWLFGSGVVASAEPCIKDWTP